MTTQIEKDHPNLPQAHDEQNDLSSNIPYGVAPETYELLLFARDHKEILDKVDSLDKGKNRIVNPTRNLLYVYYFNDVSIRELRIHLGGDRRTNGKRMLEALGVIWQQSPSEIQLQYPKEKAVRLKENPLKSPRKREKNSKAVIALWRDPRYREKNLAGIQRRRNDPNYIQSMKERGQRRGLANQRKRLKKETIDKITRSNQEYWNKRHGIDLNDPLAKKTALVAAWRLMSLLLGHSPSSTEIKRLKREGKTNFSVNMYRREFGQGSYTRAREILTNYGVEEDFYKSRGLPLPTLTDLNKENIKFTSRLIRNQFLDKGDIIFFETLERIYNARQKDFDNLPPEIKLRLEAFASVIMQEVKNGNTEPRNKFIQLGLQFGKGWFYDKYSLAVTEQKFIADKIRSRNI